MNTNYNNQIDGVLDLIDVHGTVYQLGKDASNTEGGITKLFNSFETYKNSVDGAYNARTVYNEVNAIKEVVGIGAENSIVNQISELRNTIGDDFNSGNTIKSNIAAAKTTIAIANGEKYLDLTEQTDNIDSHKKYTISTKGIDSAMESAIAAYFSETPNLMQTLGEISSWLQSNPDTVDLIGSIAQKVNKISNGVEGNIPSITSDGSITDSGYKPSDFQATGNYKTTQTAVPDPTASGSATAFISSISQNANGEITVSKKNVQLADTLHDGLMSSSDFSKLYSLTSYTAGTGINISANGEISVYTADLPQPNVSPAYSDVQYAVQSSTGTSSIVIDGSKPIHVVTLTSNTATVTVGTQPAEGHSTHVFFCSDANRDITISHNSSSVICPNGENISLTVPAGGYVEVDFLRANNKLYVRGI